MAMLAGHYPPLENQIVISQAAYYALFLMVQKAKETKTEWLELPTVVDSKNKANHVQELVKQKHICEERHRNSKRELRLIVDFERVTYSKRASNKLPAAVLNMPIFGGTGSEVAPETTELVNVTPATATLQSPTHRKLTSVLDNRANAITFYDLEDFVRDVNEWQKEFQVEAHQDLSRRIRDLKARILNAEGAEEYKLFQELSTLVQKRTVSSLQSLLEAIKDQAQEDRYAKFKLASIISLNPHDYVGRR